MEKLKLSEVYGFKELKMVEEGLEKFERMLTRQVLTFMHDTERDMLKNRNHDLVSPDHEDYEFYDQLLKTLDKYLTEDPKSHVILYGKDTLIEPIMYGNLIDNIKKIIANRDLELDGKIRLSILYNTVMIAAFNSDPIEDLVHIVYSDSYMSWCETAIERVVDEVEIFKKVKEKFTPRQLLDDVYQKQLVSEYAKAVKDLVKDSKHYFWSDRNRSYAVVLADRTNLYTLDSDERKRDDFYRKVVVIMEDLYKEATTSSHDDKLHIDDYRKTLFRGHESVVKYAKSIFDKQDAYFTNFSKSDIESSRIDDSMKTFFKETINWSVMSEYSENRYMMKSLIRHILIIKCFQICNEYSDVDKDSYTDTVSLAYAKSYVSIVDKLIQEMEYADLIWMNVTPAYDYTEEMAYSKDFAWMFNCRIRDLKSYMSAIGDISKSYPNDAIPVIISSLTTLVKQGIIEDLSLHFKFDDVIDSINDDEFDLCIEEYDDDIEEEFDNEFEDDIEESIMVYNVNGDNELTYKLKELAEQEQVALRVQTLSRVLERALGELKVPSIIDDTIFYKDDFKLDRDVDDYYDINISIKYSRKSTKLSKVDVNLVKQDN